MWKKFRIISERIRSFWEKLRKKCPEDKIEETSEAISLEKPKQTNLPKARFKITKEQEEIYNKIESGDIVFCTMPYSREKLEQIPEGHRIRPYVIAKKEDHMLYGYYCTTKKREDILPWKQYVFTEEAIKYVDKIPELASSYVRLEYIVAIPACNIEYWVRSTKAFEREQMNRRVYCGRNHRKKASLLLTLEPLSEPKLREGDVVKIENQFWFLTQFSSGWKGMKANRGGNVRGKVLSIQIDGKQYFIEVDHEEELPNVSVENLYNLADYENLKRLHDVLHPQNKFKQMKKEEVYKMAAPQYTMRYPFGTVLQNKVTNVEWFYLFSTPYGHWVYNAEFGFVEQVNESNLRNSEKEDEDAQLTEQGRRELMSTVMDLKKKKKHAQFRAVLRDIKKTMEIERDDKWKISEK